MRKSLTLFIVLLIFIIGGTCYVSASLLAEKDNVQITETVVMGDKSVVEGVTVERNNKFGKYMRWNTTYVVGEEPVCETVYTFDEQGGLQEEVDWEYRGLELYTDVIRGFDSTDTPAEELQGVDRAMKELFDKTESGQESSMIIDLADYLDFYEYEVSIDLPGDIFAGNTSKKDIEEALIRYSSNESYVAELKEELYVVEKLTEFFKIPVIENHLYEIAVSKDMNGNLYGWSYGSASGGGSSGNIAMGNSLPEADAFSMWIIPVYTEDVCYFTFHPYTNDEKLIDTSYIPGGFGIYKLPFDEENRKIDVDNLRMVYALDPEADVLNLHYDERRNTILLLGHDGAGQGYQMTVFDADTMEMKQAITFSESGYGAGIYMADDFIVLDGADTIVVISVDENGIYRKEIECDISCLIDESSIDYIDFSYTDFDWDGEKLIFGGSFDDDGQWRYYYGCGFYLAVYDESGLIYYGEYESSLDTETIYANDYYNYNFTCRPTDNDPIKINW